MLQPRGWGAWERQGNVMSRASSRAKLTGHGEVHSLVARPVVGAVYPFPGAFAVGETYPDMKGAHVLYNEFLEEKGRKEVANFAVPPCIMEALWDPLRQLATYGFLATTVAVKTPFGLDFVPGALQKGHESSEVLQVGTTMIHPLQHLQVASTEPTHS